MADHGQSTRSLFADLIDGVSRLVRQEVQLAQAESSEKVTEIATGAISIAVGVLIAFVALVVLVQALVVALANVMPASLAAVVVGVALALIALFLVNYGKNNISVDNLTLPRTRASLKTDTEMVAEKVK